jgi:hypothetical protein
MTNSTQHGDKNEQQQQQHHHQQRDDRQPAHAPRALTTARMSQRHRGARTGEQHNTPALASLQQTSNEIALL